MRFALPEGLGAVSGAVLGGSWALLGAVLGCPGRQLGAKLVPKRAPEADKNDLDNWALFGHPLAPPFPVFHGFWCQHEPMLAPKSHLEAILCQISLKAKINGFPIRIS